MTEETVIAALFALVSGAANFVTTERRLKLWTDVPMGAKPALYLYQRDSEYVRDSEAVPEKTTLNADVYLYTEASKNPRTVPATQINALVAAVRATLAPHPVTGKQTLGGLVAHCWIEGKTIFDPGDIDNQGLAVIPIKILVPTFF